MAADWKIETEIGLKLIRWQLNGFFHIHDIEVFHEQSVVAVKRMGVGKGQHVGLSDITGMVIQSQEAVDRFGHVLSDPDLVPVRHAVIVPPTLVRSQFLRVAPNAVIELFVSKDEALVWLFPI